jgi:hypothetical protein
VEDGIAMVDFFSVKWPAAVSSVCSDLLAAVGVLVLNTLFRCCVPNLAYICIVWILLRAIELCSSVACFPT